MARVNLSKKVEGKYDDLARLVREGSEAEMVVVFVVNGRDGSEGLALGLPHLQHLIPRLLVDFAQQMQAELDRGTSEVH